MAPSALLPAPIPDVVAPTTKYTDWRADLQENGYAIVKNAVPRNRALGYQQKAFDWLLSFDNGLDLNDPSTWTADHLPVQSKINTFNNYAVAHEKFMWDTRLEPGIVSAFARLWGTEQLLVSFDALNITLPNRTDKPPKGAWEHIDQSPLRRGLHCVQGIVCLSKVGPEDGGLVVYPGSHKLNDEFFDTQTDKETWDIADKHIYTIPQLEWFAARGITPRKIEADVGDLILWDSRTIHYGAEPSPLSDTIRTVIYVAYTPARLATEETLKKKADIFRSWGGTSHWPHDNIRARDNKAIKEDGTLDPKDRTEPVEKPEITDRLLKLAGVKAY